MIILSIAQRAGLALLLGLLASAAPLAAAELEEEIINPSEVIFRDWQPYDDGGDDLRLQTRRVGDELVYFRKVRFDREQGYVDAQGESIDRLQARPSARDRSAGSISDRYDGDDRYAGDGGYRGLVAPSVCVHRVTARTARFTMAMACMAQPLQQSAQPRRAPALHRSRLHRLLRSERLPRASPARVLRSALSATENACAHSAGVCGTPCQRKCCSQRAHPAHDAPSA